MKNKTFEVGRTYTANYGYDKITVIKRTEKTIWYLENSSARIFIDKNGCEAIRPKMGLITYTYSSSNLYE
jgi:hypothetical protein